MIPATLGESCAIAVTTHWAYSKTSLKYYERQQSISNSMKNCKRCRKKIYDKALRAYCSALCRKLHKDVWRREYQRNRWRSTKQTMDALFGPCAICGSCEYLEYDHRDPASKSFEIKWSYSVAKLTEELVKCQCLCRRCHRDKTSKEQKLLFTGTKKQLDPLTNRWYYKKAA